MKIVIATGIYPPDAGGPATYTRAMARALVSQGHEVSVVAYGDQGSTDTEDGFSVTRVSRSQPTWKRYLSFMRAVQSRAKNVDLVYLQGPVSEGFPGTIGAMLAGKPTVMKIVGDYAWEMYMQEPGDENKVLLDEFIQVDVGARLRRAHGKSIKVRLIEMIERWTAKRAKKVIVPSVYLNDVMLKWGVLSKNIKVIYNNVEPPDEGLSRDEARNTFGIVEKKVLFTAVRAVPWKNIDFIISLLPELDADIMLAIAGDGPSLDGWKAEAKKYGVEDRAIFLGKLNREQMGSWYRAADLFVLPSGYEGYPNVIPEAWSQGLPCFVSDKGGNPELHTLCTFEGDDKPDIHYSRPYRVLSYLDQMQWLEALREEWPRRFTGYSGSERKNKESMVSATIDVLESVI